MKGKHLDIKKYDEVFILDTNILLNDANSIEKISEKSRNLIILPEIVLDELDSKKSGFDEINFQARNFGRLLSEAVVIDIERVGGSTFTFVNINHNKDIDLVIVSKERYMSILDAEQNIKNDRKILEVALDVKSKYGKGVFLSLDVMARHRALSLGLETDTFDIVDDTPVVLFASLSLNDTSLELKPSYTKDEIIDNFCTDVQGLMLEKEGNTKVYYRTSNAYVQVDEAELKKQSAKPKNVGQMILSSLMLDETNDIVISNSPAGSGKTCLALSAAMKLLDDYKGKYDKIVYIRKTVISDSEELGFLPGTLDDKMAGYLGPLYSNLEYIANSKYKTSKAKLTKEEVDDKIKELITKYGIISMYEGHLRGKNIRNAVLIWDEIQNDSVSSAKTILTRLDDSSRVFAIGSTKQIDNKYVNKHNCALTFLLSKINQDNGGVKVAGMDLTQIERSKIAEWADNF